jgi:hypothetical protein
MANKKPERRQAGADSFQLFNLETMSGVFPGTRTARFQRIRLVSKSAEVAPMRWAQLLWYDNPPACVAVLKSSETEDGSETPLMRLHEVAPREIRTGLRAALDASGYQAQICGECHHWLPLGKINGDQLPVGRCGYRVGEHEMPAELMSLTVQSALALDCPHFQYVSRPKEAAWSSGDGEIELDLRRAAEVRKEAEAGTQTLRGRLGRLLGRKSAPEPSWTEELLERTGVGAGAEACFACQGRIANLGALTVASPEDDKQTYSVWRCRQCFTTYLNRWIDRWERLDSLETDETYWRVAPAEALALLELIASVRGGEHPVGRHERTRERDRFEAFVARRTPISHQVKLGR